jgi:hypothetical protein
MISFRQLATAVIFSVGSAIAFAGSAWAEDLDGAYTATASSDGSPDYILTFTPCGPGCARMTTSKGTSSDAHLADGTWTVDPFESTGTCDDGTTTTDDTHHMTINAETLAGTTFVTYAVACPEDPPDGMTIHFQLAKTG